MAEENLTMTELQGSELDMGELTEQGPNVKLIIILTVVGVIVALIVFAVLKYCGVFN